MFDLKSMLFFSPKQGLTKITACFCPNEGVHSKLHTFPPTFHFFNPNPRGPFWSLTFKLFSKRLCEGIGPALRKDDSCDSTLSIYIELFFYGSDYSEVSVGGVQSSRVDHRGPARWDLHCQKSNQNFRDITRNVKNEILHEIFRIVSRFPRYISCYITENQLLLGHCTAVCFKNLFPSKSRDHHLFKQMIGYKKSRDQGRHIFIVCSAGQLPRGARTDGLPASQPAADCRLPHIITPCRRCTKFVAVNRLSLFIT